MLTPKFPYQKEERLSFLRGVLSVKRGNGGTGLRTGIRERGKGKEGERAAAKAKREKRKTGLKKKKVEE